MADKEPYSADDIKRRKRKFDGSIDNRAPKMDFETDECYILVAEDIKTIFLWKGKASSTRSRFIGVTRIKKIQDQQGREGKKFKIVMVDEGEEPPEFRTRFAGKTESRKAKVIKANESHVNYEQIMQKLEEIKIPDGFEREIIIIGNNAYSVVEKVQSFLGKKEVTKEISRVGTIPEGIFFAEDYTPRILTEGSKILAVELLKRTGQTKPLEGDNDVIIYLSSKK